MFKKYLALTLIMLYSTPGYCIDWSQMEGQIQDIITKSSIGRHSIESEYEDDGTLTVSGYVSSQGDKDLLLGQLSTISGIKKIDDKLDVKPTSFSGGSGQDEELRKKVLESIKNDVFKDGFEIQIETHEREITIKGVAASIGVSKRIAESARKVKDVTKVNNLITIQPAPSDEELKNRVQLAFSKETNLQADNINIVAKNGVVILSGKKKSHRVIDRILSIANMVDGVEEVKSRIELQVS